MRISKILAVFSLFTLLTSCSGLFDARDESITVSFSGDSVKSYEPVLRAVANANQNNCLYATAYVSGIEKPFKTKINFNQPFSGFSFTIGNLPVNEKVDILFEIDDALTLNKRELALFSGYAKDVNLKETKSVKIAITSKASTYDGETIQSPTIYYVKFDLPAGGIKKSRIIETETRAGTEFYTESFTVTPTDEYFRVYPENGIIAAETPEYSNTTRTYNIPQGNIWYAKDINSALSHISKNGITYNIKEETNVSGPATWPRIIIGTDAVDAMMTSTYSNVPESGTPPSVSAHIYLNGNTITTTEEVETLFSIGQNTNLYFYNGTFDGKYQKGEPLISTNENEGQASNLLFSNIKYNSFEKQFLNQNKGVSIFTDGSVINGNISATGEVAVAGATVKGEILISDGHIDLADTAKNGDCQFTASSSSIVDGNIKLLFKTTEMCSTLNIGNKAKVTGLVTVYNGGKEGGSSSIGFTGTPASKIKVFYNLTPSDELHELFCFNTDSIVAEDHKQFLSLEQTKRLADTYLIPTAPDNNYDGWNCKYEIISNATTGSDSLIVNFINQYR